MYSLIELEFRKMNWKKYTQAAVITLSVMAIIICIIPILEQIETEAAPELFSDYETSFSVIRALAVSGFVLFSSVLITKIFLNEYKTKTVLTLFAYPVSRKKIIFAKMGIVMIWTLLTVFLSGAVLTGFFLLADSMLQIVPEPLPIRSIEQQFIALAIQSVSSSGLILIPLALGMIKKSVPTTILSTFLILAVLNIRIDHFSIQDIIAIPLSLAGIGLVTGYITVRKLVKGDLIL